MIEVLLIGDLDGAIELGDSVSTVHRNLIAVDPGKAIEAAIGA